MLVKGESAEQAMFDDKIIPLKQLELFPEDSFYVTVNGRIVDWKSLNGTERYYVHFRQRGGKGGFGSLLRSFRIHRSTNQLMCRDLSGRRLADIKEEEKLRKWIERAAEREEEKRRRKREKYEKLKKGPPKHDFNDPDYIQTREKILDKTDDAFEAGIAAQQNDFNGKKFNQEPAVTVEDGDSESDPELPTCSKFIRKRKCVMPAYCMKKPRVAPLQDLNVMSLEHEKTSCAVSVKPVKDEKAKDLGASEVKSEKLKESNDTKKPDVVYKDISLDDYENAESLHNLGLDHLKYALKVRGLKCGGSLAERASRLYSVKGLEPSQYPKAVLAGGKK